MQPQYGQQQAPYQQAPTHYQQYPQTPQQYQQAPPQQAVMPMPNVVDATTPQSGPTLKIRNLEGRAVLVTPMTIARDGKPMKQGDPPQTNITCTVVVLDGGALQYGDDTQQGLPCVLEVDPPYEATGVLTSHTNIIRTLEPYVGTGTVVQGRITRGITNTQGNSRPWNLVPLDPSDPARQLVAAYYAARASGQAVNPTPRPINGGPRPAPSANGAGQVQYVQPMAQQAPQQSSYAPMQYAQQAYQPAAQAVGQAAPTPAPVQLPPAPLGWDPSVWASLTDQQRAQISGAGPGM